MSTAQAARPVYPSVSRTEPAAGSRPQLCGAQGRSAAAAAIPRSSPDASQAWLRWLTSLMQFTLEGPPGP